MPLFPLCSPFPLIPSIFPGLQDLPCRAASTHPRLKCSQLWSPSCPLPGKSPLTTPNPGLYSLSLRLSPQTASFPDCLYKDQILF